MTEYISLFIAIIVVLATSALCSMTEAALFSVPAHRVRTWVESKLRFSRALLKVKQSMDKPIATIVVLNNISNIVGSIVIGGLMKELFNDLWVGILSGLFTFLVIIISEIIPKMLGERYCDSIALFSANTILVLTRVFTPFLIILGWFTRPFRSKGNSLYSNITEDEIKMLARIGTRTGILEKEEEEIIRKALMLHDIPVKAIMTPRIKIIGFDEELTLKDVKDELLDTPFSRVPLYKGNLDDITGLLYKVDALTAICEDHLDIPLSLLKKEVLFIPENKPIDKLMEDLRINQSHTAVVIDEYGGTAGLATLEDILEELVGDIVGIEDIIQEKYTAISKDEIIAPGAMLVDEINEYFGTKLENHRTVSKLILDDLNRFPNIDEKIETEELIFIVEELTEKTIEKVKIIRNTKKVEPEEIAHE